MEKKIDKILEGFQGYIDGVEPEEWGVPILNGKETIKQILSLFSDFQKKEKERICGELEKSKKGVEYLHEITTQGAKTEKQIHDLLKMREGYNQAIDDALAVVKGGL